MCTFHSVRQKEDDARLSDPLGLSRGDKLVNDALGRVEEIAKLSFPADEGVGIGHRVTQFEAEDAKFRQRAVADGVRGLVGVQVAQRLVGRLVGRLVVQDVMAVTERAALHILARQADVNAFLEQRTESHGLAEGPVDRAGLDHLHTGAQDALDTLVDDKFGSVGWRAGKALANVLQSLFNDAGIAHLQRVLAYKVDKRS